jgi:hypothetical protein
VPITVQFFYRQKTIPRGIITGAKYNCLFHIANLGSLWTGVVKKVKEVKKVKADLTSLTFLTHFNFLTFQPLHTVHNSITIPPTKSFPNFSP